MLFKKQKKNLLLDEVIKNMQKRKVKMFYYNFL